MRYTSYNALQILNTTHISLIHTNIYIDSTLCPTCTSPCQTARLMAATYPSHTMPRHTSKRLPMMYCPYMSALQVCMCMVMCILVNVYTCICIY